MMMSLMQVEDSGKDSSLQEASLKEWQKLQLSQLDSPDALECLLKTWRNFDHLETEQGSFCNGSWDNVYCWPTTKSGSVVIRVCSEILRNVHPEFTSTLEGKVIRSCLINGSWAYDSETIYDECLKPLESYLEEIEEENTLAPFVQYILFFGSLLSLLCLSVTLAIFYHYRCLRCDRVTVQIQLIVSLVLRFTMMLIITDPFLVRYTGSYRDLDILCEAVLVLFLYASFASVTWMFIQGLYLNVLLMTTMINVRTEQYLKTAYYIIGWVVPTGFVSVFVITMVFKNPEKCWHGYSKMSEMWILLGPVMFELVVNAIFLCNILRILMRKVRIRDRILPKLTAKAAAILFPVLGINNLILLHNPGGEYNKYFIMLNTFFDSTQGIFVSLVYCFTNKEVIQAIRRSIQRANARRQDSRQRDRTNDQPEPINSMELQEILHTN